MSCSCLIRPSQALKNTTPTAVLRRAAPCCVVRTHASPNFGPFPFPKEMFLKFVRENNGYFPVKIQALQDGTCVHKHTPVYQVGVGIYRYCYMKTHSA
jgi:nicotinic acid phosphoribosyltransferase